MVLKDGPQTDNKVADFMNNLINAFLQGGETAAEAYVVGLDPAILALPIVELLIKDGLSWIGNYIDAYLARAATGIVIDIQTNGEKSDALNAATALQFAIASGDQAAIQAAADNAAAAYKKLINWDGSATNVPTP